MKFDKKIFAELKKQKNDLINDYILNHLKTVYSTNNNETLIIKFDDTVLLNINQIGNYIQRIVDKVLAMEEQKWTKITVQFNE